ncbi:hypothetical protein FGO68_gene2417 [Halteria grandinella]|uniref:Uncharacterized protein n=1 Tax=Halteria grandinella TaxID=5974 RepID=A0A8J8P438_HALGN|nr:hypothetical protein FGO68_gene2417 [Halteria grandinella]
MNQKEVKAKQPSSQPHQVSPARQQQLRAAEAAEAGTDPNAAGAGLAGQRRSSRQEGVHERRKQNSKQYQNMPAASMSGGSDPQQQSVKVQILDQQTQAQQVQGT